MNGGITDQKYYIQPTDSWRTVFVNAFNNWNNTSTDFSFSEKSNNAGTKIDCYTINDSAIDLNGYALFYIPDNSGMFGPDDPPYANWDFVFVYLNTYHLAKTTTEFNSGVASHEIGHGLGLAHVTNQNALMCTAYDGRKVTTPQQDDINGVNYLY